MVSRVSRRLIVAFGAALAAALPAGIAHADAIDGNWCYTDGRHFTIEGSTIITPAGTKTTGDYRRHYFSYKIPAAEPDGGAMVNMALVNEDTVHLTVAAKAMQVWKRCGPIS
jgi:hypothetical protein